MDLHELGSMLRAERERQGLSLEDVSDKIKITRSCLSAIEEGNASSLPHPVYAKGFIKNYAKLLGVNQEEFSRNLAAVYPPEEAAPHESSVLKSLADEDCGCTPVGPRRRSPVMGIFFSLVALVALAGGGWYVWTHVVSRSGGEATSAPVQGEADPGADTAAADRPVPVVPRESSPDAAPDAAAPSAMTPTPGEGDLSPAANVPADEVSEPALPEPTAEDRATEDIATSGPAQTPAEPAPQPATPAPGKPTGKMFTVGESGTHVVSIVAKGRCWLQAGADGGPMREVTLEKGDGFTGRFTDSLLMRLGNAGAVEIRFDNKLYPLQVGSGSVKTLKFVAKKSDESAAKPAAGQEAATPAAPQETAAPAETTAPAAAENAQGEKQLEIVGQDGSWVIILADKEPAKEVYMKKGQHMTVPFHDSISVKLGNPSKVLFVYNGKETPVTTQKGESKTVRFP